MKIKNLLRKHKETIRPNILGWIAGSIVIYLLPSSWCTNKIAAFVIFSFAVIIDIVLGISRESEE